MATPFIYPNVGALFIAETMQTALAGASLQLFQTGSVTLSQSTTKSDLDDAEADYTGYTPGGQTITAWMDPLLNPVGGASIESGLFQFSIDAPYTTPNTIQGWYIVESGGTLVCAGDFASTKPLVGAGDGIPFNVELIFGI